MTGGGGGGFGSTLTLEKAVPPGSRVKKGEVVAEFDRQDAQNRLDDFQVRLAQTEASIKGVKAQLLVIRKAHAHSVAMGKAEVDKARLDLKSIPVRSENATEILKLNAEEAEAAHKQLLNEVKLMEQSLNAQVRVAELIREEARLEMERVKGNVDRMVIRAPIDGIVVMQATWRGGEQGQVQQGDPIFVGMPFARIVDPDSMLVSANVNQADAELIRIGARARVRFDAYPELELPARVHAIGAMPKTVGWRANYVKEIPVTVKLEGSDPRVIPDLSASVDVVLESEQGPAVLPREAVFLTGDESPEVFVQRGGDWERREVELGLANHVAVVVRKGVRPGEIVAADRPPVLSGSKRPGTG